MLQKINPTSTVEWTKLSEHFAQMSAIEMIDLFEEDDSRFDSLSINHEDLLIDYSKNRINNQTIELLIDLAKAVNLDQGIKAMFSGNIINETEGRAVLHTALRQSGGAEVLVDGKNILPDIQAVRDRMKVFCEKIHNGNHKGFTGKKLSLIHI